VVIFTQLLPCQDGVLLAFCLQICFRSNPLVMAIVPLILMLVVIVMVVVFAVAAKAGNEKHK
jgi:hypothetical protein